MMSKLTSLAILILTALFSPLAAAATVAAGDSLSCAVTAAGGVKCWGIVGTNLTSYEPVDVPGLTGSCRRFSFEMRPDHRGRRQMLGPQ